MIFNRKKRQSVIADVAFHGEKIEVVDNYKYLGSILTRDLSEVNDIERLQSSFNKCCGMFFRKFGTLSLTVKKKLLETLCLSFYGCELWSDRKGSLGALSQLAVSYHFAMKKLLGLPKRFSNHYACSALGSLTFENFINMKLIRFFNWLAHCKSPCFVRYKLYFMKDSMFSGNVHRILFDRYQVTDFFANDFDAIISRIKFVQDREFSSNFFGL